MEEEAEEVETDGAEAEEDETDEGEAEEEAASVPLAVATELSDAPAQPSESLQVVRVVIVVSS